MSQDYFRSSLNLRGNEAYKATIFEQMREFGADYAEASYSGGNDEGGIDGIRLFKTVDGERQLISLNENYWENPWNAWEHPLHEAFNELLSLDFGTWAGEFSASGHVYADAGLIPGRVWREGEESTYSSSADSGEY